MATRVYFPEAAAAPVTVTPPVGWTHDSGVRRKLAVRSPGTSALVTTDFAADAADDLNPSTALLRQYVSDPLAAQTISGTIVGQLQCLEDHANNNLGLALRVYTVNPAGTTVTHTLLALQSQVTEINTALRNQPYPSTALVAADIAQGERLVLEIGLAGTPGPATGGIQGHNGQIRWGETASSGDLPADSTATLNTYRGWVEFSANLAFFLTPATLPDALALTETQTKGLMKAPTTEALLLTETQRKALGRAPVTEALGLTDQLTGVVSLAAAPAVTPGLTHWALRHFAAAHWVDRHWAVGGTHRLVQEAVALAEQVTKRVAKPSLSEALALTETSRKALQHLGPSEALGLTELLTPTVSTGTRPTHWAPTHWALTMWAPGQWAELSTGTRPTHWAPTHWALKMWAPSHWAELPSFVPPSGDLIVVTITEALSLTDAVVPQKLFPLPPAEGLAVGELDTFAVIFGGARLFFTIPEALSLTDAVVPQKRFPLPPAEGLLFAERLPVVYPQPPLRETLGLIENLTSPRLVGVTTYSHWTDAHWTATHWLEVVVSGVLPQNVSDSLGLAEGVTRRVSRLVGEALALSESLARQIGRPVPEALPLSEALTKRVARALTEALPLVEVAHASFALRVLEALSLSEGLARSGFAQILLGESLALSEGLTKLVRAARSDALALTESLSKGLALALSGEALPVDEQLFSLRVGLARSVQDSLSLSEGLTRRLALQRSLADVLALDERLLRDGQSLIIIRHYILPPVHLDGSTRAPRIVVDYPAERLIVADEEGILV